ncbi:MAG: hypothetical protein ACUVXD_18205, partial [Thermodesulfobacteriota bacterium]
TLSVYSKSLKKVRRRSLVEVALIFPLFRSFRSLLAPISYLGLGISPPDSMLLIARPHFVA